MPLSAAKLGSANIRHRQLDVGCSKHLEAGRNPAVNRFVRAFNRLGYDLIAVPRSANVSVTFDTGDGAP
jgi:hypothetical protein